jgi:hypothetical protein
VTKELNRLEYERWLLEAVVGKIGYSIMAAQENDEYVQFTVRKQIYASKTKTGKGEVKQKW